MKLISIILTTIIFVGCANVNAKYANNYANNTIIGSWEELDAKNAINELILKDNGKFSFTQMPFETYKDYWGSYTINKKVHTINFQIKNGNNVPKDTKLKNVHYYFDKEGHLILNNFYYGTISKQSKRKDRYIFRKYP